MQRTYTGLSPNTALGYITAGYNLPMVENRGKLLLLVDATMEVPLGPEIAQLKRDLTGDGWTVQVISAARRDSLTDVTAAADTKALIKAAYDADPANVKQVYILGHVPVPYAGNSAWDGHGNHSGAWSADGFYGDMDGTWTDSTVNNNVTANVRLTTCPATARLDQSTIPSTLELMVGRVDLLNMQRAPASNVTETALLRRYLRKAHDFKTKRGAYANVERRVLIRDGFGTFGSEGFMRTGWAWGFTGVGRPPEVTFDEAPSGNWWTQAARNQLPDGERQRRRQLRDLLQRGGHGGLRTPAVPGGVHVPVRQLLRGLGCDQQFHARPAGGQCHGRWAGPDLLLGGTAELLHASHGHRGNGGLRDADVDELPVLDLQQSGLPAGEFWVGGTHCGLLGDPSLRMHVVEPPRHLVATSANSGVSLAWAASTEPNLLGYHVYRADSPDGPFTRLTTTPAASNSYEDTNGTAGNAYTYMVRVLKLENAPGGTY